MKRAISSATAYSLSVDEIEGVRKYASPSPERTKQAEASSNEILPGLLIGSLSQCATAARNGYATLSVRHIKCSVPTCVNKHFLDLDTFTASKAGLDAFADELHVTWCLKGQKTFVHCFHGIERAPLAVAYAIKRDVTPQFSFEEVYAFVRRMRPVALDRTKWLGSPP
jgi:hypothetical protein